LTRRTGFRLATLFFFLHMLSQVDRHMVSGFAPDIMRDLDLTRGDFALIAGVAFSGVYALVALAAGIVADRIGRVRVLTTGVGLWSLSTGLAGMAQGFWTMLAARPFVAAGEATLVPTATTIILARTADQQKATAIGLFFAGGPLGIGASFLVAGTLGPYLGWRACFFIMAALGFIMAVMVSRVRDTDHEAKSGQVAPSARQQLNDLWSHLRQNARLRYATIAIILLHAHSATTPFVQLWLHDDKGINKAQAASLYGTLFIVFGMAGAIGAGYLTDWLNRRFGQDRVRSLFWIQISLVPLIIAYRFMPAESPFFLIGMIGSILFITAPYGPIFSVIERELPDGLKATSAGVNMLVLNLFIIGGISYAIGVISEAMENNGLADSWTWPMFGADIIAFAAIGLLWLASRHKSVMP
jgi:predicted MFS family arabinose efflux permease